MRLEVMQLLSMRIKQAVAEILTEEAVEKAGYDSLDAAKEEGTAFVFMGHGTSQIQQRFHTARCRAR